MPDLDVLAEKAMDHSVPMLRRIAHPKRLLAHAVGQAWIMAGRDRTFEMARRSCLVLAPHPDDETLGCGVSIMRRIDAGVAVAVVVASGGGNWPPARPKEENIRVRREEAARATEVLGLPRERLTLLGLPDGELSLHTEEMADAISHSLRAAEFQDVLCTSPADPHPDHAALGRAAIAAVSGTEARLLFYPIWQWERPRPWLRSSLGLGRPELMSTLGYLERKRAALACYASQLAAEAGPGLEDDFLANFFAGKEIFFPFRPAGA